MVCPALICRFWTSQEIAHFQEYFASSPNSFILHVPEIFLQKLKVSLVFLFWPGSDIFILWWFHTHYGCSFIAWAQFSPQIVSIPWVILAVFCKHQELYYQNNKNFLEKIQPKGRKIRTRISQEAHQIRICYQENYNCQKVHK